MQITKEGRAGIIVTIFLHGLVLLGLLFIFLAIPIPPDPPLGGGGGEIDFGYSAEGTGTDLMAVPTGPIVSQNPSETQTPVKASQDNTQDVMTNDKSEEAISIPKPTKNPTKETVKQPEKPKPVINQGAILPGKQNKGGGQGDGKAPGNQGSLNGIPNGGGNGGGNGTGTGPGNGPGSGPGSGGTGINARLDGRTPMSLPKPRYTEQEDGTVVVKVTVDRNGKVVNATTDGVRGSTTTNKALHAEAITAARQAKFSVKADAAPEQIGYIYYTFIRN